MLACGSCLALNSIRSFRVISQPSIRGLYAPYCLAESAAPDGFLDFDFHESKKGQRSYYDRVEKARVRFQLAAGKGSACFGRSRYL